mgnify:FL=1
MSKPLILTYDVGTQSARAILVDKEGSIVDKEQVKYEEPYFRPRPGWAEQKTDFYFEHMCAASKALMARNADRAGDIIACAVTVIRDTLVFLDENNKPTRDIIHWLDARKCLYDDPFPLWKEAAFELIGMGKGTKIAYRTSKVNWVRQKQPKVWEKTKKIVCLPAYLNFRMTGRLADTPANTIAHIPMDYKKKRWMKENELTRCIYDVPQEKLYELIPSGEVLGYITKEAAELSGAPEGLPLIATGADKACETLGLSVASPEKASISFGTSSTIEMYSEKYFEPQKFLPSYPSVINKAWNPEIQVFRGFWMLSWFIKEFGDKDREEAERLGVSPEEILNKKAAEVPAGCQGLMLQPYWTPDVLKPDSYGAIIGFSDYHTRYHIYRAIIEGICLELYMSMKSMERRGGMNIKEIFVGGGGSRSDLACQILADTFGLPVKRIHTHEACSIGAAMVAFVAKGEFKSYDEAIKSMVHEKVVFTPDPKNHEIYMNMYNKVYRKIYRNVRPLYATMNNLKERNML